eukprot:Tbor_TRINITY_DN762_c0_g1::TRINITY_DN762_c0_g1_i1::g.3365::m.3365
MSSDDDDDGIPLPPQNNCFTGNFQRLTSTGQFQSTFSSRSPFNVSAAQSPTSPKSSFHCDRGQSFRLYASQGKGALLPKRGMGTLGGTFNDESFCRSVGEMTSTAVSLHSLTTPKSIVKQAYQELKTYLQTQCPSLHATDSALQSSKITIKKGKLIGSGGYANVYCGLSIPNNEIIAIKEFSMDTDSKSDLKSVEDEFALLRKLRHPNVVRYVSFEHSRSQGMCRIMLEFMSGGSTADMAYKFGPLPEHILKKFAKNIFSGLEFIHQEGIFHRDIKPANLLIDSTGRVKLADFGCSRKINEASSAVNHLLGTPIYMSPEFIKGRIHRKSDVWAAGCTLFELSTGYLPWHHTKIRDHLPLMFHITTSSETPLMMPEDDDREFSEEFVDFLSLCFERDVEKRPEAYDLLKHPWIVNLSETDVQFQHQLEEMCAEQCGNICKLLSTDILDSGSGTTERSPQEVYLSGSHYIKRTSMHSAVSSIADSPRLSRSPFGQWSRVGDSIGGGTYTGGIFGSSEDVQQFIILKEEGDHATLEIGTQKVWDPLGRTFDIDDVGFDGSGKIDSVNNSGEVCSSQSSPRLQSKPSFVCDMPKVMQLSFKQRDGHKVSMGLNIHPDDVSMKVIDRKPSFVVSMSDRIRSQIATAMVEENYEVDESEDGVDDADTNVLQRHVSMRVSTTSNPPLRASSMYHDSASSPSWTSPVRCPHSDNLSVYYSGDKKDINRKESPV